MKLITLAISCVLLSAQSAPPRDATPAQKSSAGAIRGRIVAAATAEPLHRVRVTLGTSSDAPSAVTDARGEYEILDVPPSSYTVTAARAGFLTIQYGQRYPREAGRTLDVEPGQTLTGVDLALPRWSVLAGAVSDELGELYPNVTVEAIELRYIRGRRVPVQAASTRTNDLGQFRVSGLQPGSYTLRASTTDTWQDDDGKQTYVYAHTYFPGVTQTAEAASISVAVGQQVTGLDFAMRPGLAARITGVMRDAAGNPITGQAISLSRITRGVGGSLFSSGAGGSARTGKTGAFDFPNLPPGEYTVNTGSSTDAAAETVVVADGDTKTMTLAAGRPTVLSGTIVADDGRPLPFVATRMSVVPISADPELLFTPWQAARDALVSRDGSFKLNSVEGPHLYRITGLPDDWMLSRVMLAGRNYIDAPLDAPEGTETAGLQLVVSNVAGRVTGTVVTRDGTPAPDSTVIVFPPESGRWTIASRFIKAVRPDHAGRFTAAGLPTGAYRVAARAFVADGQWEDPEFLTSLLATSARVEVADGATATVTVTLEPQP